MLARKMLRAILYPLQNYAPVNRPMVERGLTPIWMYNREECTSYWRSCSNAGRQEGNRPCDYAAKDTAIVGFLAKFWSPEVSQKDAILELGCNCGVNLNALEAMGYSNLSGIEINPHAIAEMQRAFPALNVDVMEGSLESVLPTLPDKSFGCAFSMAVLMHVHPSSHSVFKEIARVARKIVTIEAEGASCGYVFPRNYRHVFEHLGLKQIRETRITSIKGYEEYTS